MTCIARANHDLDTARTAIVFALALTVAHSVLAQTSAPSSSPAPPPSSITHTDSRAPYIHRLTLYDETGKAIDPAKSNVPYSPVGTCAKCHPYGVINHGWHFNAQDPNAPAGRPGEPWLLVDTQTRTVLPISGRGWPGTYKPEQIGLTNWRFVQRFGAHFPGGGYGEPSKEALDKATGNEKTRWAISGPLNVDCMSCHSAAQQHDQLEAARQIDAQNFKWLPTAALGLAVIRGEAKKLADDFDPEAAPNPDYPNQIPPKIVWDKTKFDPDGRVLFDIPTRMPSERCEFCHTVRLVGPGAPDDLLRPRDVHLAAGLLCVDCHREEVEHMTIRGYDTEASERRSDVRAVFSCEGCHLGGTAVSEEEQENEEEQREAGPGAAGKREADRGNTKEVLSAGRMLQQAENPAAALGGRYRAPRPRHPGLPLVHFQRLTCTACHAGPWPEMKPKQVQTSMAHGLGLTSEKRRDDDLPRIIEPIFAQQPDGKLAPQRMIWPAFWARLVGQDVRPLLPEVVARAAAKVLTKAPKPGEPAPPLTQDEIRATLEALAGQKGEGEPVYVFNGLMYRRNAEGKLETTAHAAAQPYRWSLGHDVRPASQALGVRGCTDCHAPDAPVYFGAIGSKDDPWQPLAAASMVAFRNDDVLLGRAWALGFVFRPYFKCFSSICALLLALVLVRGGLDALGRPRPALITTATASAGSTSTHVAVISAAPGQAGRFRDLTGVEHLFHTLAILGTLVLAVTGFGPDAWGGQFRDWVLFAHMLAAPLFILGLAGTAVLWTRRVRFSDADPISAAGVTFDLRAMFWLALATGFVVFVSILLGMFPLAGHAGQDLLRQMHKYGSLVFLGLMVLHTVVSLVASRTRRKAR